MDNQVLGDPYFEARLELFKVIAQDYREAFKRSTLPTRDQGFFLCGQMCDFLHRLLRRIVTRSCLPAEWDWDALRSFDFAVGELLGIPEFMQKTEFRAKVLKVARSKIDVKREPGKKAKSDVVARTVMGESFNPFFDQSRQYIKYVAKELLRLRSDQVWLLVWGASIMQYCSSCQRLLLLIVISICSRVSARGVGLHESCVTFTLMTT